MKKKYDTPSFEVITLTLLDVIMASEAEGAAGGGDGGGNGGFSDVGFDGFD